MKHDGSAIKDVKASLEREPKTCNSNSILFHNDSAVDFGFVPMSVTSVGRECASNFYPSTSTLFLGFCFKKNESSNIIKYSLSRGYEIVEQFEILLY